MFKLLLLYTVVGTLFGFIAIWLMEKEYKFLRLSYGVPSILGWFFAGLFLWFPYLLLRGLAWAMGVKSASPFYRR